MTTHTQGMTDRDLTAAHRRHFLTVAALADPAERANISTAQIEAITRARDEWVALRDIAVVEMNAVMPRTDVAAALGLTYQRIQQICARVTQHPGMAKQLIASAKRRAHRDTPN